MKIKNEINEKVRDEHYYDYAALKPLLDIAYWHSEDGRAKLWMKDRWDPKKGLHNAEFQSVTLEMYVCGVEHKLEAWVYNTNLIILVMGHESICRGLEPTRNYHLDLRDPDSIDRASKIVSDYLNTKSRTGITDWLRTAFYLNKHVILL